MADGAQSHSMTRRDADAIVRERIEAGERMTERERIFETRRLYWTEERLAQHYGLQSEAEIAESLAQLDSWAKGAKSIDAGFEAFAHGEDQSAGYILARRSQNMPGLPPAVADQLEKILDGHGLRATLRSLRELVDSRCDPMGLDQTPGASGDAEAWGAAGNMLEMLLHSKAVCEL